MTDPLNAIGGVSPHVLLSTDNWVSVRFALLAEPGVCLLGSSPAFTRGTRRPG